MASAAPAAGAATGPAFLSVNNIEVVYSHVILVLKGVSLAVPKGGIVALLGANGAGKTTTLKAISNLLHAERGEVTKGSIEFDGATVHSLSPNELVTRGCIQVMEGRHCFEHLTIEENLLTGAYTRRLSRAQLGQARAVEDAELLRDRQARVLETVTETDGRVRLAGETWSARVPDGAQPCMPGDEVRVVSIDGATAIVEKALGMNFTDYALGREG